MAIPTPVNGQITDNVTQAQHLTVGSTSAVAVASALQSMAHAAGINMLNASQSYQQWSITQRAATTQAVVKVLSPGAGAGKNGSPVETTGEKEG